MELTIIQNGALYALHHRATKKYRGARKKRVGDLIRAFPALTTFKAKMWPVPARAQSAPQHNGAPVADAFPESRMAA
jgi:hypothetical protein